MPAIMQCDMVGKAPVDEALKPVGNISSFHLHQETIPCHMPSWKNCGALERHPVVAAVAVPQPRYRNRRTSFQASVDDQRPGSIEMSAECRPLVASHGIANIQGGHSRMPEKDRARIVLEPVREKSRSDAHPATDQSPNCSVDIALNR